MYTLTALGVTVSFHRLFAHRSFETGRAVQFALAVVGSMAVQGPLLKWVAFHRHHQHSDRRDDPHSPHHAGRRFLGLLRGLWHAHLGWVFRPDPPDLRPRAAKRSTPSAVMPASSAGWRSVSMGSAWPRPALTEP
jgi:stearoyl-CoA desaturase (delta-9 desaturase)